MILFVLPPAPVLPPRCLWQTYRPIMNFFSRFSKVRWIFTFGISLGFNLSCALLDFFRTHSNLPISPHSKSPLGEKKTSKLVYLNYLYYRFFICYLITSKLTIFLFLAHISSPQLEFHAVSTNLLGFNFCNLATAPAASTTF